MQTTEQLAQRASEITYTASAATTVGGLWVWLGENATAIGAVCIIIGALIGVATFGLNWYYKHAERRDRNQ